MSAGYVASAMCLGQLPRGTVVELRLTGNAANVWLMDSSTYSRYERGQSVRAIGGHTKRTPVSSRPTMRAVGTRPRIYAAIRVDWGYRRESYPALRLRSASDRTCRRTRHFSPSRTSFPKRPSRTASSMSSSLTQPRTRTRSCVPRARAERPRGRRPVRRVRAPRRHSLRRKIDQGIARSRFGLVVLSPSFFAKNWPQYELDEAHVAQALPPGLLGPFCLHPVNDENPGRVVLTRIDELVGRSSHAAQGRSFETSSHAGAAPLWSSCRPRPAQTRQRRDQI
jgi:hypothetical protein